MEYARRNPPKRASGRAREVTAEKVRWFARKPKVRHAQCFKCWIPGTSPSPGRVRKPRKKNITRVKIVERTPVDSAGGILDDVQHGRGVTGRGRGHGAGVLACICIFALKGDVGSAHVFRARKVTTSVAFVGRS